MSEPPAFGAGTDLDFMGPMSGERADRLAGWLAARRPVTVLDLGCGWGELLLRVLTAAPGSRGTGIDTHGPDIARAQRNAQARGLTDRVNLVEGPARDHGGSADLVLCVGAYQAFGTVTEALAALRGRVAPGGVLLFGAEFWERTPTPDELGRLWPDASADDCLDLEGLVEAAVATGFRPLAIETATRNEWEAFESGLTRDLEVWLLANSDHPAADDVRQRLDATRSTWLWGRWQVLGFAYLILGVPLRDEIRDGN